MGNLNPQSLKCLLVGSLQKFVLNINWPLSLKLELKPVDIGVRS